MQQSIVAALSANPILTLFLVIGLGYLFGEISVFGFKFGVAGVLFVGLAVGSLSPSIAIPEAVSTLGLIIFVYAIGIHSGPSFFDSFRREGCRNSLLTVAVLVMGAGLALSSSFLFSWPSISGSGKEGAGQRQEYNRWIHSRASPSHRVDVVDGDGAARRSQFHRKTTPDPTHDH